MCVSCVCCQIITFKSSYGSNRYFMNSTLCDENSINMYKSINTMCRLLQIIARFKDVNLK